MSGHGTVPASASAPAPAPVTDFVRRLRQQGVQVSVTGPPGRERLRVRAPTGRLSEADRERLRSWRAAIIASLTAPATPTTPAPKRPVPQIGQIGQIPRQGLAAPGGDTKPLPQIGQIGQIRRGADPPCPRCERLDAEAAAVLRELSDRLPPSLRGLPPERLARLVAWTLIALSNPRPQWPPPPAPATRAAAPGPRPRPVAQVVEDLGGPRAKDAGNG